MSELLWRIVDSVEFPLLVTVREGSHPAVRPMHFLDRDERCLWFATSAASAKVEQIARNPLVTVIFSRPDLFNYASVYGRAEVLVGTREQRRALWREEWSDHWPLGVDDPDYVLICVTAESSSYYFGYMDR
ncbi:MAG: pyridoxamine 5'-phosphate oxidase family protein, partial [Candidatus Bipolaricaulota bacterium]